MNWDCRDLRVYDWLFMGVNFHKVCFIRSVLIVTILWTECESWCISDNHV